MNRIGSAAFRRLIVRLVDAFDGTSTPPEVGRRINNPKLHPSGKAPSNFFRRGG